MGGGYDMMLTLYSTMAYITLRFFGGRVWGVTVAI